MLGIAAFQQVIFYSIGNPIITDGILILVIVGYDNSYLLLFHFSIVIRQLFFKKPFKNVAIILSLSQSDNFGDSVFFFPGCKHIFHEHLCTGSASSGNNTIRFNGLRKCQFTFKYQVLIFALVTVGYLIYQIVLSLFQSVTMRPFAISVRNEKSFFRFSNLANFVNLTFVGYNLREYAIHFDIFKIAPLDESGNITIYIAYISDSCASDINVSTDS